MASRRVGFSTGGSKDSTRSLVPNKGAAKAVNRGAGAAKRGGASVRGAVNRRNATAPAAGAYTAGAIPKGD